MKLQNIHDEKDLRVWIKEYVHINLQWVEPSLYGSSVGAADIIFKGSSDNIQVELKYLYRKIRGIKFTLRPAQRMFHRSSMRKGQKTCLLFALDGASNQLFLVRGDRVPLRDYAVDPESGCAQGKCEMLRITGGDEFVATQLRSILLGSPFWE